MNETLLLGCSCFITKDNKLTNQGFSANEPAEGRRSAGDAAENSAARRMAYAKKFSIGIEKCKCEM